jgi:Zn-dependent M28 family amino/carboxypeptidase
VDLLLELARTLPAARPRATRILAAFATEEEPFFGTERMGSHVFARGLREAGVQVESMISLDLVGYFSDAPGSQRLPLPGLSLLYPDRGDFIAVVGDMKSGPTIMRVKHGILASGAIPVHSFRAPASRFPVLLSDHWSFRQMGFPAVQITDTAFMRYPYYHRPEDVPEHLDYERMADLVVGLHGVLFEAEPL